MLEFVELYIPKDLNMNQVRKEGIDHYNDRISEKGKYANQSSNRNFLNRITVNYIVHELAGTVDDIYFPNLGSEGHSIINNRLRDEIFNIYPDLEYDAIYSHFN